MLSPSTSPVQIAHAATGTVVRTRLGSRYSDYAAVQVGMGMRQDLGVHMKTQTLQMNMETPIHDRGQLHAYDNYNSITRYMTIITRSSLGSTTNRDAIQENFSAFGIKLAFVRRHPPTERLANARQTQCGDHDEGALTDSACPNLS